MLPRQFFAAAGVALLLSFFSGHSALQVSSKVGARYSIFSFLLCFTACRGRYAGQYKAYLLV